MIASAIGFLPTNDHLIWPMLLMLAGAITLGAALWLRREWGIPAMRAGIEAGTDGRVRIVPLIAGIALLALTGIRSARRFMPVEVQMMIPIHAQAVLLLTGIVLLLVGAGGLRRAGFVRWRTAFVTHEALLLLAIMTLAFGLRIYHLGDAVSALVDEGPFVEGLEQMRDDPVLPLLASMNSNASFTRLFAYFQLVLSELFGSNLFVFRLAGVIFGTLTVGATYWLARLLFDRRTALIAALLLSVFPPHIHMSRIGINNIADPLFGVLALAFFVLALQTRLRLYYVLSGAMLGLLTYFYEGGELLYPPLLLAWAVVLAFSRDKKPSLWGMGWVLLTALLLALPVYLTYLSYDLPLFTRLDKAGAGGDYFLELLTSPNGLGRLADYFRKQLLPPLLHYVHAPDGSVFYGGQTALILPPLVPLFLLGLAHGLRRRNGVLLVLWVLATALGNSLIVPSDWTARFVVVMPAIAMVCAVGLRYTWAMLGLEGTFFRAINYPASIQTPAGVDRVPQELGRLLSISIGGTNAFALIILLLSAFQIAYYFGPHLTYYNEQQIINLRSQYAVVFRTMEFPSDTIVYFHYNEAHQVSFFYAMLKYMGDRHVFHAERFENYDFTNLAPDGRYASFVDAVDRAVLAKLEALWYLDGPHYDVGSSLPVSHQFGLYLATPLLRRPTAEGRR
jgi:hypothetical protein